MRKLSEENLPTMYNEDDFVPTGKEKWEPAREVFFRMYAKTAAKIAARKAKEKLESSKDKG